MDDVLLVYQYIVQCFHKNEFSLGVPTFNGKCRGFTEIVELLTDSVGILREKDRSYSADGPSVSILLV